MNLRHAHLYPSLALAIALQLTIAWCVGYVLKANDSISISGALDKGEVGLSIGVGLAGSFEETSAARSEAPEHQQELIEPEAEPEQKETQTPVEPEPEVTQPAPDPIEPEPLEIEEPEPAAIKAPQPEATQETQPKVNTNHQPDETNNISPEKSEVSEHSEATNETPLEQNELEHDDKPSMANIQATGTGETSTTGGTPAEQQSYLSRILAHAARFKRYPRSARKEGVTGTVHVNFYLRKNGRIESSRVIKSSGDSRLDQAALDVLVRASPFPSIPESLSKNGLDLTLPIEFSLNPNKKLF